MTESILSIKTYYAILYVISIHGTMMTKPLKGTKERPDHTISNSQNTWRRLHGTLNLESPHPGLVWTCNVQAILSLQPPEQLKIQANTTVPESNLILRINSTMLISKTVQLSNSILK